jgi:predicted  nucleic acid-binding Zn-ribbon protein
MYVLVLSRKFPGEGFADLEKNALFEVLECHASELCEENFEDLRVLNQSEYEANSENFVEKLQLFISALKKSFQLADELVNHFFEAGHFM